MEFILKILFYLFLCTGVQCISNIRFLKCKFSDQESFKNNGTNDIRVIHKEVILQFGDKGNAPVSPDAVTFLLTGTSLDLRSYLGDKDADELQCELHRHSTNGAHVQWPLQETQGYNYWYNCIIKHGLFTVTSFLRQPSQNSAPGHHDYHNWTIIKDGDVLTTSVALIMKTTTPEVKSSLGTPTKLDCQFVFDHQGADYTVEWYSYVSGLRKQIFIYNSRSKLTEGTGVDLKALEKGDASYNVPPAEKGDQKAYVCSVSVKPLVATVNINWRTEEKPRVSLNVPSVLSVNDGEFQRIICQANHYYPMDVKMIWYRYKPTASSQTSRDPVPDVLDNKHSSHSTNNDNTISLSTYLDLRPSVKDSGTQFICSVFHQSLNKPIRMSFIINVEDPLKRVFIVYVLASITVMSALLYMFCSMRSARRRRFRTLPY